MRMVLDARDDAGLSLHWRVLGFLYAANEISEFEVDASDRILQRLPNRGSLTLTESPSRAFSMQAMCSSGVGGALGRSGSLLSSWTLSTPLEGSCALASGGPTAVAASSSIPLPIVLSGGEGCEARFRSFSLLSGSQKAFELRLADSR